MPKLSIMVAVYKVEKYLEKCIDSILAQTFTDFELILINDGSPDKCPQICEDYKQKDDRIIVIHKENGGLADARNVGLTAARGEYLGFVDSDDYIAPEMFETLIRVMEDADSDMVICDNYRVYPDRVTVQHWLDEQATFNRDEAMYHLLVDKIGSQVWNKLYKRELFGDIRYPVGRTYCQDLGATFKYVHRCKKVVYIKQPLYYYLIRNSSASYNYSDPNRMYHVFLGFKERYEFAKIEYPQFADDCLKLVVGCGIGVCYGAMLSKCSQILQDVSAYLKTLRKNILHSRKLSVAKKFQAFLLICNKKLYFIMQKFANTVRESVKTS